MATPKRKGRPRPRAVLYLRQSIAREESISLDIQESAGRQYAAQRDYDVIAVESDPGISGRTWNRPAVQRVMQMIETKEADVIILWKWSRLSRARLDWAVAVDKVEAAGGSIESATEPVDVNTSTGRFARGMLAEFAAFESERIGDTWKESQQRRVNQGLPPTGRARFGYHYDRDTGYTPHPEQAPVLQECYRRFLAGHSFGQIHEYMLSTGLRPSSDRKDGATTWARQVLITMMDNPFAAGYIRYRGELYPGAHEPIIDPETWDAYTVLRAQTKGTRRRTTQTSVYTGYLYCTTCGHKFYQHSTFRNTPSYSCNGAQSMKLHKGGNIIQSRVDEAFTAWLADYADTINQEAAKHPAQPAHQPNQAANLRRALVKAQAKLDGLTAKYVDDVIPRDSYERLRDERLEEIGRLQLQLKAVEVEARRPAFNAALVPDLLAQWGELPVHAKRKIVGDLVARIEVTGRRPASLVRIVPKWEAQVDLEAGLHEGPGTAPFPDG